MTHMWWKLIILIGAIFSLWDYRMEDPKAFERFLMNVAYGQQIEGFLHNAQSNLQLGSQPSWILVAWKEWPAVHVLCLLPSLIFKIKKIKLRKQHKCWPWGHLFSCLSLRTELHRVFLGCSQALHMREIRIWFWIFNTLGSSGISECAKAVDLEVLSPYW